MHGLLIEGGETIAALTALCLLPLITPPTRRVTVAAITFAKRHAPRWMVPLLIACAFIPGPVDELLVIAAIAYLVLSSRHNRRLLARYVSYAWQASPRASRRRNDGRKSSARQRRNDGRKSSAKRQLTPVR